MAGKRKQPEKSYGEWGGKREGAGRPVSDDGPMVKTSVTLSQKDIDTLLTISQTVSGGIRFLTAMWNECPECDGNGRTPFDYSGDKTIYSTCEACDGTGERQVGQ